MTPKPYGDRRDCIFHLVRTFVVQSDNRRPAARQFRRARHLMMWLLAAIVAVGGSPARGWSQVAAPGQPLPAPVGYVNDFANVLKPDAAARIDDLAKRVNAATRGEMVVVTLPNLGGRPVEEVSLRLGREWKVGADAAIGDQARNAGVIILLVPKETSDDGRGYCRIETGQGTEGFITDATSGTICREAVPEFRRASAALPCAGLLGRARADCHRCGRTVCGQLRRHTRRRAAASAASAIAIARHSAVHGGAGHGDFLLAAQLIRWTAT